LRRAVIVSHRFSTVTMADRIVVVESGRIREQGTHAALLAAGGRYAGLCRAQADAYGNRKSRSSQARTSRSDCKGGNTG
jgi:ABC-type transport system involved in cytochrome bd biosynthesis fused ATPase/permease subunit